MRTGPARALLALAVLAPLLAAGCFGGLVGEARTEWAFTMTQLDQMAKLDHTGKGVTIAVLDTGVNPQHPALAHLFDGDPGNGEVVAFQDYVHGRNGVANAYDDVGHGSHVLGIIGADGSTLGDKIVYGGVDLLGGAPDARFVVAKVCESTTCDPSVLPGAIRWAVAQGARVLSLSLGQNGTNAIVDRVIQSDLQNAVNDAIDHGVVVVASAGNDGTADGDVKDPAGIPGVLAVGAVDKDAQVWARSNRGNDSGNPCQTLPVLGSMGRCDPDKKPELVAPGVEVLSAWTEGNYVRATGTSQACPFVTSTVALLLEGRPDLTSRSEVERLKEVLEQTALHVGGQKTPHDDAAGYGIVQAKAAYDAYRPA